MGFARCSKFICSRWRSCKISYISCTWKWIASSPGAQGHRIGNLFRQGKLGWSYLYRFRWIFWKLCGFGSWTETYARGRMRRYSSARLDSVSISFFWSSASTRHIVSCDLRPYHTVPMIMLIFLKEESLYLFSFSMNNFNPYCIPFCSFFICSYFSSNFFSTSSVLLSHSPFKSNGFDLGRGVSSA